MARLHRATAPLLAAGLLAGLAVLAPAAADDPPAAARAPFLEKDWAQPTVREEQTRNILDRQVIPYLEQRGEPAMPATTPLVVNNLVLFRSHWGLHAVNLRTGKLEWESDSRWSVDRMLRDPGKTGALTYWLNGYRNANQPGVLLDNSLVGGLSSDGHRLFAVEDFQVAPLRQQNGNVDPTSSYGAGLAEAVQHSRLQAFDLVTGKLVWELGAPRDRDDANPPREDPADLAGSYFLAAPLVLGGNLYVLNEKDANLRLVCLEPVHGSLVWLQHLASFRGTLAIDPQRRMRADTLAYADGVLVCPTNAGILVAIDLTNRTLLWAHSYREPPPAPPTDPQQQIRLRLLQLQRNNAPQPPPFTWRYTPPLIHDGKVVYTPEDGRPIFCLDLHSGTTHWQQDPQQDDLYVGGIFPARSKTGGAGRVLIVGKKSCRAVSLAEGKTLWTLQTGAPSGRGAADGQVYYLPVRRSAVTGDPEVVALDVEHGRVVSHTPSRKQEVAGNLVFTDGLVVSQTAEEVTVYPQVRARLRQIGEQLAKDPNDVRALLERGELKLAEGDPAGAADDLRHAAEAKGPEEVHGRAQAGLFDALTELLQRDFAAGEKHLDEYEKLCRADAVEAAPAKDRAAERARRRSTYAFVLARGREHQNQLRPAVRAYLEVLAAGGDESIPSPDDPAVRVSRSAWAGAHLAGLLASAAPGERRALEEVIAARQQALRDGDDRDAFVRLARAVGGSVPGRDTGWQLAERLRKGGAFLETELVLLQLRHQATGPAEAARALEALARLYADNRLLADAAHCYRELGRDYARTEVRDGKTGADLLRAAAEDARLKPHLDEPSPVPPGQFKVEAGFGNYARPQTQLTFEPEGDVLPYFRRNRVSLDLNASRLRVVDRLTNEELWSVEVPQTSLGNFVNAGNPGAPVRLRFQVLGHLIVLDLGQQVLALDPVDRRRLWDHSLVGPLDNLPVASVSFDAADGKPFLVFQDGWLHKVGQVAVVGTTAVCFQTRAGVVAVEPYSGGTLWSRADVPTRTLFFHDDRDLFVIEGDAAASPVGTRAFRAADGAGVPVPDCSALYARRTALLGRDLLLTDPDVRGEFVLRLYDARTGKDAWEKRFPAGSRALHSDDPALCGVVESDGRVTILDTASGRRLASVALSPRDLTRATQVHLLHDRAQWYLACDEPLPRPGNQANSSLLPNAQPGSGLRAVPVNGKVYAFDRATGELSWEARAPHQMLFVDGFAELPALVLSGRYQTTTVNNGQASQAVSVGVRIISKRTGKLVYDEPNLTNAQPFHTLNRSTDAGSLELLSGNFRVALTLER